MHWPGACARGGASGLRIAATPTLAASLLPQAVAAMQRQYPAMQCDLWAIHTPEIEQRLATQEIDAGIALEPPERVTVAVSQLAETEILLAVPWPWVTSPDPGSRQLTARPCIALAESTPLGDALAGLLERARILASMPATQVSPAPVDRDRLERDQGLLD